MSKSKISMLHDEIAKLDDAPESILDRVLNDVKEFTEHRIDLKAGPPKDPKLTWEALQAFDGPDHHIGFLEGVRIGYLNDKIDGEFSEEECIDRIYTGFRHKYGSTGLVLEDVLAAKDFGAAAKQMEWGTESQLSVFETMEQVCAYILQHSLSRQQIREDKKGVHNENKGRYGDGVSEVLANILNYLDARCLESSGWTPDEIRAARCKERVVKKQEMGVSEAEILKFIEGEWLTPDAVGYVPKTNTLSEGSRESESGMTKVDLNVHRKEVLELILKSEGGLNENEPSHVGGVSYAGITQQAWDVWRSTDGKGFVGAVTSVRALEGKTTLIHAFYEDYFTKYHVWELPEFLQYIFADFVVNAGGAAVKIVQSMVGENEDGVWGSGTSQSVSEWKASVEENLKSDSNLDNELITEFHNKKIAHYEGLAERNPEKFGKFLPGWKRRANNVLADLGKYFETEEPTTKAIDEDDVVLVEPESEKRLSDGTISADDLANALLNQIVIQHNAREEVMIPETGEMVKVQPFRLTDRSYHLPTKDEVLVAIEKTKVDEIEYVAEEWDCEDFARRFVSKMHDEGIKTAGRVMAWSGSHCFNIVAVQHPDDGTPTFMFVEPQTDRVLDSLKDLGKGKYNIENCLIIIS